MIKIKNLNKIFNENTKREFHILKNINLEIKDSSCIVIKGISGSGKSTLLSIIGTLLKPTSGSIEINGENISKLPDLHASKFRGEKLGFIFQSYNLFNSLSVKDNVSISLIPLGFSQKQIDELCLKALELANISHKKDEFVYNLSGGEKQRCTIARAMVNNPEIILCDEPTANLDFDNSIIFIKTLEKLKALNKIIIVATHDPIFDNLEFVDKIINIKNGIICE